MEWQFKSIARKSALSDQAFSPGDRVVCLIFKDVAAGEMGRADILLDEVDAFELPGDLLGRWNRTVKDPDDQSANARETMASAEDFFLSLYQNEQPDEDASIEEAEAIKHLLALMLERKRVLRALGPRQKSGLQTYLHVKTKQNYAVPVVEISADLMLKIQDTFGDIIL